MLHRKLTTKQRTGSKRHSAWRKAHRVKSREKAVYSSYNEKQYPGIVWI